ncbi:uncharacterized protein LOC128882340, partial [Hylaeus volcanicus]|uniref:uncharacterized protein LOC128882340 n=1 Tax=Hylaeus volcanicus TaxID=313075 RepID=UPI0023B83C4E
SRDFVEKIRAINVREEDLLVSFDVKSLFTKVPIEDTLQLMKHMLNPEEMKLAELCLKTTYFLFNGKYYKQIEGASMGSPLSPLAAEVFMEDFEKRALASAKMKPTHWFRYVDDTFVIWPHGREHLDTFFKYIDEFHTNIKFTMEIEKDGILPFLDVKIEKANGRLEHTVYRKPTHTDRYLNAASHHHPAQKNTLIRTLMNRALRIAEPKHFKKEERHLKTALRKNGYGDNEIKKQFTKAKSNQRRDKVDENRPNKKKVIIPYIKGTTERIAKTLRKFDIETIFTTDRKIGQMLRNPKDSLHLRTPGIYSIPCSCGKEYIGQTGRLIRTRLNEHMNNIKNVNTEKSAVAEHFYRTNHVIEFDKANVLASIDNYQQRVIREAIEIVKQPQNFNKEDGYKLSKLWHSIIPLRKPKKEETPTDTRKEEVEVTR